jgi:hypothetical protein
MKFGFPIKIMFDMWKANAEKIKKYIVILVKCITVYF